MHYNILSWLFSTNIFLIIQITEQLELCFSVTININMRSMTFEQYFHVEERTRNTIVSSNLRRKYDAVSIFFNSHFPLLIPNLFMLFKNNMCPVFYLIREHNQMRKIYYQLIYQSPYYLHSILKRESVELERGSPSMNIPLHTT